MPCNSSVRSLWLVTISRDRSHETDLPPSEPAAPAEARLPGPNEDPGRSGRAEPPPPQGPQATRRDETQQVEDTASGRYRFPRSARIRHKSEIQDLFRRGKRRRTEHLDVFVTESPALRPRLALVVPKHGHKIVRRNRLKRRLREAARHGLLPACRERGRALDILIRARPEAYGAEFEQLRGEIIQLAEQLC